MGVDSDGVNHSVVLSHSTDNWTSNHRADAFLHPTLTSHSHALVYLSVPH